MCIRDSIASVAWQPQPLLAEPVLPEELASARFAPDTASKRRLMANARKYGDIPLNANRLAFTIWVNGLITRMRGIVLVGVEPTSPGPKPEMMDHYTTGLWCPSVEDSLQVSFAYYFTSRCDKFFQVQSLLFFV